MKILFEGEQYDSGLLRGIISPSYCDAPKRNSLASVNCVGYYFNPELDDSVIILPKVFVYNGGKAFGEFDPKDIIDYNDDVIEKLGASGRREIISELPVWIYRAVARYNKRRADNGIHSEEQIRNVVSNIGADSTTMLDIILSLIRFHKENHQLFTYIAKISASGRHKIDWTKTVTRKPAYIEEDSVIHMNVVSRRKEVNYEEQLVVLFYSVLNYLKDRYNFSLTLDVQYPLLRRHELARMFHGNKGTRFLKKIRYKYFTDKFLALWKLLFAFFEKSEYIAAGRYDEEVMLVKDFHLVFEDMIDDLISDTDILTYLKNHRDGKQVDHIYRYPSVTESCDDIYFIGDSKYYKPDNAVKGQSVAKQFTYARNVIQYCIDRKPAPNLRYRDELTEGYNITPNFFITAFVDPNFDFARDGLKYDKADTYTSCHFPDRLFDRDTLLIQSYDINFLFVLSAYISRNRNTRSTFRQRTRKQFRDRMLEYFRENYVFYELTPHSDIGSFVKKHMKVLNGRMYRTSQMTDSLVVAFEKSPGRKDDYLPAHIRDDCDMENYILS